MLGTNNRISLQGICILILDNDIASLRSLKRSLKDLGAKVHLASNVTTALHLLSQQLIHAILVESNLKNGNGLELLKHYKSVFPAGRFYFMSKEKPIEVINDPNLTRVDGYFTKPINIEELAHRLKDHIKVDNTSISTLDPLTELLRPYLIFRSPVMRRGLMILPKVAASNHSVLVTGDTGSGKEMVARAIHGLSPFANGPFVAVNCGAIPESLIEGELFGHEKGSFTGAQTLHRGKFELARNGTLFLDEIGEMPLALQARLLRVLEERQFYRIGGEKPINIHLRVVAATQVKLEKAVEDKLFREDLYYRLNVLRIHIPPLKNRIEDIPLLSWHFLERAFAELNRKKPYPVLSDETIRILIQQPWKGNVRELKNLMTRLAVLLPGNTTQITPDHLAAYFPEKMIVTEIIKPDPTVQFSKPVKQYVGNMVTEDDIIEVASVPTEEGVFIPVGITLKEAEDMVIQSALKHTRGNRTKAAKILGIGLRTIRRKVNE